MAWDAVAYTFNGITYFPLIASVITSIASNYSSVFCAILFITREVLQLTCLRQPDIFRNE